MKEKLEIEVAGGGGTISIICIEVKEADLGLELELLDSNAVLLEVVMDGCCSVKQTLCLFFDNGDDFQKLNLCLSWCFPDELSFPPFPILASLATFW